MKQVLFAVASLALVCSLGMTQTLDTENWPPSTDFTQEVHYWSAGDYLTIPAGKGAKFNPSLSILTGGDQVTEDVSLAGKDGKKADSQYLNVADTAFDFWPDIPVVDVLVQYFANSESKRSSFGFLLGQLGNLHGVSGFSFESVTDQWEWRLFRIDNSGGWLGNQTDAGIAGSNYAGVNGGTLRFENVTNVTLRVVAFGPEGAFGDPALINAAHEVTFDPDQYPIMAEWDYNKGIKTGIDLYKVTTGDQQTVASDNIGPAGDKRKAVRPAMEISSTPVDHMNWAILNEYFGPTSQPSTRIEIVVEYYDDPAQQGQTFGPDEYASAGNVTLNYPPDKGVTLEGSGKWKEAQWYISDVKFNGVNVTPQGAARLKFSAPIYISRLRLGVIRTSGIWSGVDPIPGVYPFDPDPYGIYAELDINKDVKDNLDMAASGGDQEWVTVEGVGPANDKRKAVSPALDKGTDTNFDRYMNFSILNEVFGPTSQPNLVFKVAVDYFDDPALAGQRFGPEVYQTNEYGTVKIKFFPDAQRLTLEGSGEWRTAAWEIDDVNLTGVNVGPQGAVRFWFTDGCAVAISRVRYAVIRPVGKYKGVDKLADVSLVGIKSWELF